MRVFITVLVLIFSLQSWTKADDIRDFEIEGMSIGDSLLDYFSEEEIINAVKTYYPNSKKFYSVHILVDSKNYDQVSFGVKDKDNKYIIYKIAGDKYFKENPNLCLKKLDDIAKDFDIQFGVANKHVYRHQYSSLDDGKSYSEVVDYDLDNNSAIRLWCNFFTKETIKKRDLVNGLTVSLDANDWLSWLNKEAYK